MGGKKKKTAAFIDFKMNVLILQNIFFSDGSINLKTVFIFNISSVFHIWKTQLPTQYIASIYSVIHTAESLYISCFKIILRLVGVPCTATFI